MRDFAGSAVIVTGAGSGIGQQVAIQFANAGATVACISKTLENAKETSKIAGPNAFPLKCDVKDFVAVEDSINFAVSEMGKIDILVNVAGVNKMSNTHEEDPYNFDNIVSTNLNGTFHACRYSLPFMLKQKSGCIINTSSAASFKSLPWSAAYSASKAGINKFTQALAFEYKDKNIRVNAVSPGAVDTNFISSQSIPVDADISMISGFMLRSGFASPAEIAKLYLYIASDDARFINGSIISIDGGITA